MHELCGNSMAAKEPKLNYITKSDVDHKAFLVLST